MSTILVELGDVVHHSTIGDSLWKLLLDNILKEYEIHYFDSHNRHSQLGTHSKGYFGFICMGIGDKKFMDKFKIEIRMFL